MQGPVVSVIVVNYNGGAYLQRCLDALLRQVFTNFEAIVVDNGSQDGSFERARLSVEDPRIRFVALGQNLGFAGGNNRAAAEAKGGWLALLNPDAFPEPEWLQVLIDATRRYPSTTMFGSTQIDANDPSRLDGTGDHYFAAGLPWRGGFGHPVSALPEDREVFGPCAAAALYRADLFSKLAGFDEEFFMYCEDVDFAFRARLQGERCVQIRGAVVHHVGGGIAGRRSASTRYYSSRNMIWTFVKNMPPALFWPLLPFHAMANAVLLIRALARGDMRPIWRGMREALVRLPDMLEKRRQLQASRVARTCAIARAMTWRPDAYLQRASV